jgi:hypothetical protein
MRSVCCSVAASSDTPQRRSIGCRRNPRCAHSRRNSGNTLRWRMSRSTWKSAKVELRKKRIVVVVVVSGAEMFAAEVGDASRGEAASSLFSLGGPDATRAGSVSGAGSPAARCACREDTAPTPRRGAPAAEQPDRDEKQGEKRHEYKRRPWRPRRNRGESLEQVVRHGAPPQQNRRASARFTLALSQMRVLPVQCGPHATQWLRS